MTYTINDDCIICDECMRACPVDAVFQGHSIYIIDQNKCNECVGIYNSPRCVDVCPVDCISRVYTDEQMKEGLSHYSDQIRLEYAEMAYRNGRFKLTKSQIEQGLCDSFVAVKLVFAKRTDFTPDSMQIERGLTDSSELIRREFASRLDIQLTPKQIERGLIDTAIMVRIAIAQRIDIIPSSMQIDRALIDSDVTVRRIFAGRSDCKLTLVQIERGLKDKSAVVRSAFLNRLDFIPSEKQIERGLKDKSWEVRLSLAKHKTFKPTIEQIEHGLLDSSAAVRNAFWLKMREDLHVSPECIELGLIHTVARVRREFLNNFQDKLTLEQIERVKFDADSDVRLGAIERFGPQFCTEIPKDQLSDLLDEINKISTWTSVKKKLQDQLYQVLSDLHFSFFTGSVDTYQLSRFGESVIIDVPNNKTGKLNVFRGQRIRIICLKRYGPTGAHFAAKAIDSIEKS